MKIGPRKLRPEDRSNVVAMKVGPMELRPEDGSDVVVMRVVLV